MSAPSLFSFVGRVGEGAEVYMSFLESQYDSKTVCQVAEITEKEWRWLSSTDNHRVYY